MSSSLHYEAIIIGATGAVGSNVVRALLPSAACTRITALSRRPTNLFDGLQGTEKLEIQVIDYARIEEATAAAAGSSVAFCTIGVGQSRKATAEELWRVDVEYAGAFARGATRAGVKHISLLSAVGANAASRNRYIRTKGKAEEAIIDAGIPRTSIFRPSLLVTRDIRYGVQDRLTQALFPIVSPLLPRRFHEIFDDPEHSSEEPREIIVGYSERQRLLLVAFTERPPKVRIISAR
ncbi:MAG: hypothetical protein DMF87_27365, partial [Acidobacteria bacterium]